MTEASYTAWDDKQYVWPPPDGWYEAPDGKWWPQGYGPPPVTDVADQALSGVDMAGGVGAAASEMNGWVSDVPDLDVAAVADVDVPDFGEATHGVAADDGLPFADAAPLAEESPDLTGTTEFTAGAADLAGSAEFLGSADVAASIDPAGVSDLAAGAADMANGVGGLADPGVVADMAVDGGATNLVDGFAAAAPSVEQPIPEAPATIVGSDGFDASTSAATQAFGTGLMPPMADRPAPAGADSGNAAGFAVPGVDGPPNQTDFPAPAQAPESFDDLAAAAPVTSPPPMDHAAEQQAILDAKPKGSSRGLLFAILGVVALVVIGAALFFAFGGDNGEDSTAEEVVATGPGSVSEPHPRVTGVVVFYPDAGVEQRWIVEVLEPVRDVSEEFENDGSQTLAATKIRVTNDSGADGASLEDLRFNLVDGSNTVIVRTDNSCPPGVDDFAYAASVAVQDSVEGTVCWAVNSDDLAGLKLGIESSKVQGRVHIQLQ